MSDDMVERLRRLRILDEVGSDNPLGREAADRIEQLERENAELVALLRGSRQHVAEACCLGIDERALLDSIDDLLAKHGGTDG